MCFYYFIFSGNDGMERSNKKKHRKVSGKRTDLKSKMSMPDDEYDEDRMWDLIFLLFFPLFIATDLPFVHL